MTCADHSYQNSNKKLVLNRRVSHPKLTNGNFVNASYLKLILQIHNHGIFLNLHYHRDMILFTCVVIGKCDETVPLTFTVVHFPKPFCILRNI